MYKIWKSSANFLNQAHVDYPYYAQHQYCTVLDRSTQYSTSTPYGRM